MPLGFRAFRLAASNDTVYLQPANGGGAYQVPLEYPLVDALCTTRQGHLAPQRNCQCGYYAYNGLGGAGEWLCDGEAWIMAEVWGHGQASSAGPAVVVTTHGWRARRMQVVRFFFPLCDDSGCKQPASTYCREGPEFPELLRFGCDDHPRYREAPPAPEPPAYDEDEHRYEGQQFSLGMEEKPEFEEPLPAPIPRSGGIMEIIPRLAERFQASVYDVEATLNVFVEEPGWRDRIEDVIATGTATPDPFRQWQSRVDAAKQRGQRERQEAEVSLFQVDRNDAGYKPKLVPPSELSRLRQASRRSRWS